MGRINEKGFSSTYVFSILGLNVDYFYLRNESSNHSQVEVPERIIRNRSYERSNQKTDISRSEVKEDGKEATKLELYKATAAIQQIKEKNYVQAVSNYTGNILLVGIAYDKKTKVHECEIEECCLQIV